MRICLFIILFFNATVLQAEFIEFEIYVFEDGKQKTISKGVREYSINDIESHERLPLSGERNWTKSLSITDRFLIGGSIYREEEIIGFGLWLDVDRKWYEILLRKRPFSWDWFNKKEKNIFKKLKGQGGLRVTMLHGVGYEEIKSIEFLTDTTLSVSFRWNPFNNKPTHHIIIKKGSTLTFSP